MDLLLYIVFILSSANILFCIIALCDSYFEYGGYFVLTLDFAFRFFFFLCLTVFMLCVHFLFAVSHTSNIISFLVIALLYAIASFKSLEEVNYREHKATIDYHTAKRKVR